MCRTKKGNEGYLDCQEACHVFARVDFYLLLISYANTLLLSLFKAVIKHFSF